LGRVNLSNDLAVLHQLDVVTQVKGQAWIMQDQKAAALVFLQDGANGPEGFIADTKIQCRIRLIEKQDICLLDQATGQKNALALAFGEMGVIR